jgi:CTP synthase
MDAEKMLSAISNVSDETEFYAPMPAGYKPGRTKFVFVFGTVMSGLGKGIFSSSLAKCMKDKGLTVAPIKLEGYLNIDSGTLNPYRHGEVFVLDDGMECDMDLGTYERMLDQDLSAFNFVTSGQIYTRVLEKERRGSYLGRDVQMIPHVTGEVKTRLRELAVASHADVVFVEIGGTVGDVENLYYIEAAREMAFEEGLNSCCMVALTYILEPPTLGEQKSKAAQLGIRGLLAAGIQPNIIACRAHKPVSRKVREKLALYSNVPINRVFSMHDCESVYLIPEALRGAGLDIAVIDILQLGDRVDADAEAKARDAWNRYIERLRNATEPVTIGITGKYTSLRDSYASIIQALEHAGTAHGARVRIEWIDTSDVTDENVADKLAHVHGIIVPGGFGVRGAEGKITCIRHARENRVPYLGICYGFQMAVIEFARNVCGLDRANSTEIDPDSPHPVIDILPEQKQIEGLASATATRSIPSTSTRSNHTAWSSPAKRQTIRSCRSSSSGSPRTPISSAPRPIRSSSAARFARRRCSSASSEPPATSPGRAPPRTSSNPAQRGACRILETTAGPAYPGTRRANLRTLNIPPPLAEGNYV